MRWPRFVLVLAGIVVVGGVGVVASSGGGVDVVDEATLGERSNQTVCLDTQEVRCVDGVLESSPWRCSGVNASSFSCNVSFWLNLTVRGPGVCASGGINATDTLAPEACTSTIIPFEHEVGGPVTLTFDAGENERLVNVSGEVCLEAAYEEVVCEEWDHDPILLPSWEQWDNGDGLGFYLPAGDHQICLGDSNGWTVSGDVGPGCVSAGILSDPHCKGILENYHCDITLDMIIVSHGLGVCASLESDYAQGVWEEVCNFRHSLEKSNREDATVTKRYEHDEIPPEGRTVVVEAELCGWAFRPFAQQYCETVYKPVFLGGDPCACNGDAIQGFSELAKGRLNYTMTTVNHTTVPSVYP